jgi:hypothetical protein
LEEQASPYGDAVRSEVGIGDLLRAFGELEATDPESRKAISDLLLPGFTWTAEGNKEGLASPIIEMPPQKGSGQSAPIQPRPSDQPEPATKPTFSEVPFSVEPLRSEERRLLLPTAGPGLALDKNRPPAPEPLLEPLWTRQVLAGITATERPLGDLDVASLVRALAERRPLRRLPRKMRPTLRLGVQVLLDRDESMMVFFADQSALRRDIERLVGRERMTVLRCDRFPPTRVSELTSMTWRPYAPPPPGTPVLIVSDLGMARGAFPPSISDEASWDAFLRVLKAGENRVAALVPCPCDRYPPFVREAIHLLLWDRATRPSEARRARKMLA